MISDAHVYERNKVTWVLEQVAPYGVIARARFSRDNFRQGLTLFFECRNLVADLNQYVSE